jgi:hypothetical protein
LISIELLITLYKDARKARLLARTRWAFRLPVCHGHGGIPADVEPNRRLRLPKQAPRRLWWGHGALSSVLKAEVSEILSSLDLEASESSKDRIDGRWGKAEEDDVRGRLGDMQRQLR